MFHVPDVRKTVDWYRNIGFDVTATYDDGGEGLSFAMVRFGAGEVMFSSGGQLSSRHRREVDLYVYTDDVDGLHERIRDRVEVVEGPHNMFYGAREVIVRDLNGFWITFGEDMSQEQLTPWPAVPRAQLEPYAGIYHAAAEGLRVRINIFEGRLLAFPEDGPAVYLRPSGEHAFTPMMNEPAHVQFEMDGAAAHALVFEQGGRSARFTRSA